MEQEVITIVSALRTCGCAHRYVVLHIHTIIYLFILYGVQVCTTHTYLDESYSHTLNSE